MLKKLLFLLFVLCCSGNSLLLSMNKQSDIYAKSILASHLKIAQFLQNESKNIDGKLSNVTEDKRSEALQVLRGLHTNILPTEFLFKVSNTKCPLNKEIVNVIEHVQLRYDDRNITQRYPETLAALNKVIDTLLHRGSDVKLSPAATQSTTRAGKAEAKSPKNSTQKLAAATVHVRSRSLTRINTTQARASTPTGRTSTLTPAAPKQAANTTSETSTASLSLFTRVFTTISNALSPRSATAATEPTPATPKAAPSPTARPSSSAAHKSPKTTTIPREKRPTIAAVLDSAKKSAGRATSPAPTRAITTMTATTTGYASRKTATQKTPVVATHVRSRSIGRPAAKQRA